MASNLEIEIEIKSSAEKMWKNLREFATFFPKALPDIYEGIDVLEGDGKSVGSIFLASYKPESNSAFRISKERIELVDDEKKIICLGFLDQNILQNYKNFKATICISTKGEGALVKYTAEFVKINKEVPNPDGFTDFAVKVFHSLDDYLLKNN